MTVSGRTRDHPERDPWGVDEAPLTVAPMVPELTGHLATHGPPTAVAGTVASRPTLGAARSRAVERLPEGTSRAEALAALGEPEERRILREGHETWHYSRYLDEHHYAFAETILTFDGDRLVDTTEYRFL